MVISIKNNKANEERREEKQQKITSSMSGKVFEL